MCMHTRDIQKVTRYHLLIQHLKWGLAQNKTLSEYYQHFYVTFST